MTSTPIKAPQNTKRSGPFLRRDMAPNCSAIDRLKSSQFWDGVGWTFKYPTSQLPEYPGYNFVPGFAVPSIAHVLDAAW